ncbi:CPBP family intramembrane glutamic endopeptidase [Emticicia sp. SJ17W-69]|uniref:CPBP family intramembrane glutamic endopeptidase n=1 Tax=Emticicia sp. SJ17W-69 TaxID=3421657 RepID=UPI003EBB0A63
MKASISNISHYTWIGIIISIFSITAINLCYKIPFGDQLTNSIMVSRELIILSVVAFLCFYIIPKESKTLESIGLHNHNWKQTLWLSLLIAFVCLLGILVCIELCKVLGWKFGESKSFDKLSLPVISLITIRAGIAEEIFCRGFLLERYSSFFNNRWFVILLSSIPFGLFHYNQGYAGILIATVAGIILSLCYFWKKDLKANIIGHFLVDFIPNVIFPLLA